MNSPVSLEWTLLTRLLSDFTTLFVAIHYGFHLSSFSLDISKGRHYRRPAATKLNLDASIRPITLALCSPTAPAPAPAPSVKVLSRVYSLEPNLRGLRVSNCPREITSILEHNTTCKASRELLASLRNWNSLGFFVVSSSPLTARSHFGQHFTISLNATAVSAGNRYSSYCRDGVTISTSMPCCSFANL